MRISSKQKGEVVFLGGCCLDRWLYAGSRAAIWIKYLVDLELGLYSNYGRDLAVRRVCNHLNPSTLTTR